MTVNATSGWMATMTMAIEIPSADQCDNYESYISDVMGGLIHGFTPRGCEDVGMMNSRMMIDVQVPLLHDEESLMQSDSLFGVLSQNIWSPRLIARQENLMRPWFLI